MDQGAPRTPPLRDWAHPLGLPNLDGANKTKVEKGNELARFAAGLALICSSRGIAWAIENPRSTWIWHHPAMQEAASCPDAANHDLQNCMFGGTRDKWTSILSNSSEFKERRNVCSQDHPHEE